jgi:hypothetical protein
MPPPPAADRPYSSAEAQGSYLDKARFQAPKCDPVGLMPADDKGRPPRRCSPSIPHMNLELTDEQAEAFFKELNDVIVGDRHFPVAGIRTLKEVRAMLRPRAGASAAAASTEAICPAAGEHREETLRASSVTWPNNGVLRQEQRIFGLAGSRNSLDRAGINEKSENRYAFAITDSRFGFARKPGEVSPTEQARRLKAHAVSDSLPVRRAALVKGFRMPARHRREGVHDGRRPKSLEGGNRGGSSHRRWCRSMGNLPRLLDLICGFRTGRRLSDQPGAGFGRPGWDRRGDLVFGAPGFVGRRWRRGSLSAKHGRCR